MKSLLSGVAHRLTRIVLHHSHHLSCGFTSYVFLVLALTTFLLTLLPITVIAQSPDAEVEFFVKSPEEGTPLTVGDPITLRLEIIHPIDSRVVLPQLEKQWQAFEVVDQTAPETRDNGDGTATTGKDVVVALFETGQFETPSLVVTHRKPDGSIEELAAPIIPIKITSVLTDSSQLQDLKPQADLPLPPVWPWVLGGLLLSLLVINLLALLGLWLYRRRSRREIPVPIPFIDTRPPEVIAYVELERIENLNLLARDLVKEHYTLVAACLKRYIEGRYKIPALEQTTAELRTAFRKSGVLMRDMSDFMSVLSESDLVKFARYVPRAEVSAELVNRARAIVGSTTPSQPEPTPPPSTTPELEGAS